MRFSWFILGRKWFTERKIKKANELLRAHLPYLSPAWIGLKQPPSTSLNPVLVVDMVEIEVHNPHHL